MFLTHRPSTDPQLPASSFYRRKNQKETKKLKARGEGKKKAILFVCRKWYIRRLEQCRLHCFLLKLNHNPSKQSIQGSLTRPFYMILPSVHHHNHKHKS